MTVKERLERLNNFDVEAVALASVDATKDVHADLNVLQMNRGLRNDGSQIGQYSDWTVKEKIAKGQEYRFVTLRDTGSYQAKVFSKLSGRELITGSTDPKALKLETQYGNGIYNLSEKYKAEYIRTLRPVFVDLGRKRLGL